jgi:hypothetical protein
MNRVFGRACDKFIRRAKVSTYVRPIPFQTCQCLTANTVYQLFSNFGILKPKQSEQQPKAD